ncbi:MAG: hypothetical protein WCW33_01470 [Candidatus Babeliales bacterium]
MWYRIGLSALMFNLAFFCPEYCGVLILFFLVPLVGVARASRHAGRDGFMWGLCTFGPHFSWLLLVVLRHSSAHWLLAVLIYSVVVTCFSLSSGLWLWSAARFFSGTRKIFWFVGVSLVYWFVAIDWVVRPLGFVGYPFINPLVPLAAYRPFLRIVSLCAMMVVGKQTTVHDVEGLGYCPPVVNRVMNADAAWRRNPYGVGQKIYEQFVRLHAQQLSAPRATIWVTPESMFCFPLNYYPCVIAQWDRACALNEHVLMGSVIERDGRFFQAVFWLHKGLIIKFYVKKLLTPFVEKMPPSWRRVSALKKAFIGDTVEFCDGVDTCGVSFFDMENNLRVVPRICLEFFFCQPHDFDDVRKGTRNVWVFLFANDSWFDGVFRKILFLSAQLKANYIHLPVVYCGHFGYHKIIPETI